MVARMDWTEKYASFSHVLMQDATPLCFDPFMLYARDPFMLRDPVTR